jgi:hypothetical protein
MIVLAAIKAATAMQVGAGTLSRLEGGEGRGWRRPGGWTGGESGSGCLSTPAPFNGVILSKCSCRSIVCCGCGYCVVRLWKGSV